MATQIEARRYRQIMARLAVIDAATASRALAQNAAHDEATALKAELKLLKESLTDDSVTRLDP